MFEPLDPVTNSPVRISSTLRRIAAICASMSSRTKAVCSSVSGAVGPLRLVSTLLSQWLPSLLLQVVFFAVLVLVLPHLLCGGSFVLLSLL